MSVVIPMYNARHTIEATLRSAVDQTYKALEILVVDDGSTDGCGDIVMRIAATDNRVTLIRQHNAGVAAARNRGIDAAKGQYLAPLDADDLWASTKIERQVEAILAAGPSAAMCYSRFCVIDIANRILWEGPHFCHSEWVLPDLAREDFIGSGSNALMRIDLVRDIGGYDTALRRAGAEGAEDWLIAMELAALGSFAVVEEPLVGYRRMPGNMSSRAQQMLRSARTVTHRFAARYPDLADILHAHIRDREKWLLVRALSDGNLSEVFHVSRTTRIGSHVFWTLSQVTREAALRLLRAVGLKSSRHFEP